MTERQNYIDQAKAAVSRAAQLAEHAEAAARHDDKRAKAVPLAAAGDLWADVARTYATIAHLLPEV